MHCQMPPRAEMKMISCVKGRVWDVAVDLRSESKTFLQWFAQELSPDNLETMVIPEGCAHGFQSLEPGCELLYLHTAHYDSGSEKGFLPTDPQLNIRWPLPITMLSDRDRNHPPLQVGLWRNSPMNCRHCSAELRHTFLDLGYRAAFERVPESIGSECTRTLLPVAAEGMCAMLAGADRGFCLRVGTLL